MAQAPIQRPNVAETSLPWVETRTKKTEANSTAFQAQQFVELSSGSITACATAQETTVWGLATEAAQGTAGEPYASPLGTAHTCVDALNTRFWVNVMNSTRAVGTGSSAGVTVGTAYGMATFTTTGYTAVQGLNADETTSTFFRVEGLHPDDASTDTNGRVLVSVVATRQ